MQHRAWFTLLLRAFGILLVGMSIRSGLDVVVALARFVLERDVAQLREWIIWLVSQLGSLAELGIGLYLVLGGKNFIDWCLKQVGNLCPACGYDLRGLKSPNCPECGARMAEDELATRPPTPSQPPAA